MARGCESHLPYRDNLTVIMMGRTCRVFGIIALFFLSVLRHVVSRTHPKKACIRTAGTKCRDFDDMVDENTMSTIG